MKRLYMVLAIMLMLMNTEAWAYEDFSYEGLKYRYYNDEDIRCIGYDSDPVGALEIPSNVSYNGKEYGVTSIENDAFINCLNLSHVILPNGLTSIGERAFSGCLNLIQISLPDGLTTLGEAAFTNCPNLKQISLPNGLTSIEEHTFCLCTNLTQVSLPDKLVTIGEGAFGGCESLTQISLPDGLTNIDSDAFEGCHNLTQISFPDGLQSIGNNAFARCYSLTQVSFPDGLTSIGDFAFAASGVKTVKFSKNIERIGKCCFTNEYNTFTSSVSLSRVELGEKITYLGNQAFGNNIRLISIGAKTPPVLESKNMGYDSETAYNILVLTPAHTDFVYQENSDWVDFNIVDEGKNSATVHMSGEYSLAEEIRMQTSLMPAAVTNLTVTGPLSDIDWLVMQRNLISCYDLNLSGVVNTTIPAKAFEGNMHLLSIILPSKTTMIEEGAFKGCENLAICTLPESVSSIEADAFNGCCRLGLASLPNSLVEIGKSAFQDCTSLQLTGFPPLSNLGTEAFKGCTRLFDIDLSRCSLTQIPSASFSDCKNLRSVILPETLTAINSLAFENTSLNFIELPQAVKTIGAGAFSGTSLISLNLPSGCISLAEDAFIDCDKLATVNLSPYTQTLGDRCFSGCTAVRSISTPCATPPATASDTFKGISRRDCTIAIPTLKFRDYLNALDWGSFTQLANFIMLNYEEVDENGDAVAQGTEDNIDAGIIENNDYDDVTESIMLEEEQAAEDKARDDEFFGNNEETPEPEHLAAVIRKARAEARANAEENMDEKASKAFSRLYSGVSMTIGDNDGYRVNLRPSADVEIVKVELNGKDITSDLNGNYILLPKMEASGQLKVYRKIIGASIEDIPALQEESGDGQIYNMQGIPVTNPGHGIYIKDGKKVIL